MDDFAGMKTGQAAFVTGVSSGIGRATAVLLAERGFRVFGTYRQQRPANLNPGITLLQMDVRDDDSVRKAVSGLLADAGRIDALINNAGYALLGALEETQIAEARDQFETNFFGLMRVTRRILPVMRRQGFGRIVNVSSILGLIPGPYVGVYAASKHAIEAYTETLDHEVRRFGIRVAAVEPSFTRTSLMDSGKVASDQLDVYANDRAAVARAFTRKVRNGSDPKDVAKAIYHAIVARSPRLRYPVGEAKTFSLLRRLVPAPMFGRSLRKQFELNGGSRSNHDPQP